MWSVSSPQKKGICLVLREKAMERSSRCHFLPWTHLGKPEASCGKTDPSHEQLQCQHVTYIILQLGSLRLAQISGRRVISSHSRADCDYLPNAQNCGCCVAGVQQPKPQTPKRQARDSQHSRHADTSVYRIEPLDARTLQSIDALISSYDEHQIEMRAPSAMQHSRCLRIPSQTMMCDHAGPSLLASHLHGKELRCL